MSEKQADVLLVTDDRRLRALAGRHRPPGATLRCMSTKAVDGTATAAAGQVWIDLDATSGAPAPSGARRVYFHSQSNPTPELLPPGVFIRKPCAPVVFDVLWAGVRVGPQQDDSELTPNAAVRRLPAWLLDFQDLDLKTLCRKYVTVLAARLGYQEASLYLHDSRHGVLKLADTTHGRPIELTVPVAAPGQSLMAEAVRTGRILRTEQVTDELAARGIPRHADRPYEDDRCLVAPLLSAGELWGILSFSGRACMALTDENPPLDEIFSFLGRALHHACAYAQAQTEARVDGLTGLYNQRWMMEALEKEIRRAQRFATSLSVLMLDLDGLKAVNDQTGHAAGDCLLRHVAGRISAVLRQFDGAARVGGDEFIVMLPATNLKGARQVARRLLQSIREDAACFRDTPLPITASVGAAEWRAGWDARQLIDAADRAMYRAKAQGRNHLASHPDDRPATAELATAVTADSAPTPRTRFVRERPSSPKPMPGRSPATALAPEVPEVTTRNVESAPASSKD